MYIFRQKKAGFWGDSVKLTEGFQSFLDFLVCKEPLLDDVFCLDQYCSRIRS